MTDKEQIIIDINKCKFRDKYTNYCLAERDDIGESYTICTGADCYFKQLARKTQECEELKSESFTREELISLQEKDIDHYRKALKKIEGLVKNFCKDCGDYENCNWDKEGCYYSLVLNLKDIIKEIKRGV